MIWAKKSADNTECSKVKEQYDQLSTSLGLPFDMLMVSAPEAVAGVAKVYLTLPSEDHLALFAGFDIVPERALPREASLHFGHLEAFREWFSASEEQDSVH